jgi:hypothetical protein
MPLRRTEGSDGRQRPRWKDGSHDPVESTHANHSRCDQIVLEPNPRTEPLVTAPPLLGRSHEHDVSTRDRPAKTGADARIEESVAMGEMGLALLPYGRRNKALPPRPVTSRSVKFPQGRACGTQHPEPLCGGFKRRPLPSARSRLGRGRNGASRGPCHAVPVGFPGSCSRAVGAPAPD